MAISAAPEDQLTYRSLYAGSIVGVREYRCRACRGGPAAEEQSDGNHIVLLRHGAFCKHFGRRRVTADVNQVVFFSKGSTYRVSHPTDCGDKGTVFVPCRRVLDDIVRELDPSQEDHPDEPFPFVIGPCELTALWRHREIALRLETSESDPLWVDVTALQLIYDVLKAAYAKYQRPHRRRGTAVADPVERVEAAKSYLASRLGERIVLDDVAGAVHVSPFHFARIFQRHTGLPVHRYLTQLRLRHALQRLVDGADDLSVLALDLGFSSHSHFAETFRREFRRTPSEVRRDANSRMLVEMSKNLKV
jgi:AraC family transcriptional regulator